MNKKFVVIILAIGLAIPIWKALNPEQKEKITEIKKVPDKVVHEKVTNANIQGTKSKKEKKTVDLEAKKNNPFGELQKLKEKAIFTAYEKEQYENILKSSKHIREAFLSISKVKGKVKELTIEKIQSVMFFEDALKWPENPAKKEILSGIRYFLIDDSYVTKASLEVRKLIIADKVELLKLLKDVDPTTYKQITTIDSTKEIRRYAKFLKAVSV